MESWFPGQISGPEPLEWEGCIQDPRLPKNSWPHEVLISENSHEDFHPYPGPSSTQCRILHPKNKQNKDKPSHRQTSSPQTPENTTLHSPAHQREKNSPPPLRRQAQVLPNIKPTTGTTSPTKGRNQKEEGIQPFIKAGKRRLKHRCHDGMVLAQKQKYRLMKEDKKPRDKHTHLWAPYLWQRRQRYTMEKR